MVHPRIYQHLGTKFRAVRRLFFQPSSPATSAPRPAWMDGDVMALRSPEPASSSECPPPWGGPAFMVQHVEQPHNWAISFGHPSSSEPVPLLMSRYVKDVSKRWVNIWNSTLSWCAGWLQQFHLILWRFKQHILWHSLTTGDVEPYQLG
jgi:hypothetical protein